MGRSPIVLVDMDGVLADLEAGFWHLWGSQYPSAPQQDQAQRDQFYLADQLHPAFRTRVLEILNSPGFFDTLPVVPGAAEAMNGMLAAGWDVRVCTAPALTNPTCTSDKLTWLERHIGPGWSRRAIIAKDKSYVRGDLLIDDKPEPRAELDPTWRHVVFDAPYNRTAPSPLRLNCWGQWSSTLPDLLRTTPGREALTPA